MKILHVLTAPRAEGTPRLVLDWLSLDRHEHELLFLSPEGNLKGTFEETGTWQFYNDAFPLGYRSIPDVIRLVKRTCRQRTPDIVIAWPFGLSHWITVGARRAGVRRILAHCGNPPGEGFVKKYFHTYLCVYLGILCGNKVIACSEFVRAEYSRILPTRSFNFSVVHNALNVAKFITPPEHDESQRRDVSMVGYLTAARDHSSLLKGWKTVEEKVTGISLNIIGDGRLRTELQLLAGRLGLKNVNFTGRVDHVEQFLWGTRVYAFSTIREGFGTTLLEALAAGCSVVATDVPACREVLNDGKYGTLVPPQNPERLSEAIIDAWHASPDEDKRNKQIEYARRFTPQSMMNRYLEIAQ